MAKDLDTKRIDDFLSTLGPDELHYAYGKCDDMMEKASGLEDGMETEAESPEEDMSAGEESDMPSESDMAEEVPAPPKRKRKEMIDFSSL